MKHVILIAAAVLGLSACDQRNNPPMPQSSSAASDDAAVQPAIPAPAEFANAMASSDMFEIESAKLASERGQSQKVRDFAKMMAQDHAKSSAALRDAARKANPSIAVVPTLDVDQNANLVALRAAPDSLFDRLYAKQQVAAHQQALGLLDQYASAGSSTELRNFARTAAPVVRTHLTAAKELGR